MPDLGIQNDLKIIEEYQIFSTVHLQKNPFELFQYFCQKRLSVIRLQKYELISIVLQKLVTRRPSVKLFRQNSRIRYKRENHWSWAHFLTFPIVKERKWNSSGIRRKVFGLFAALYHLEEWLNCHWKSVKVIFRVGGHFLYLLMAEHNNLWVLGFHALQINESVIYWGYIIFWQVQIFLKYENVKKRFEQFEFAM